MKLFLVYNAKFKDDTVKTDLATLSKATEKFDYWMFPCFHPDIQETIIAIKQRVGLKKFMLPSALIRYITLLITVKNISFESEWSKNDIKKHRFMHAVPELKILNVPKMFNIY